MSFVWQAYPTTSLYMNGTTNTYYDDILSDGTTSVPMNGTESTLMNGTTNTHNDDILSDGTTSVPMNGTENTLMNETTNTHYEDILSDGTTGVPMNGTESTLMSGTTNSNGTANALINGTENVQNGTANSLMNGTANVQNGVTNVHMMTFESFSVSESRGAIVSAAFSLLSAAAFLFMVLRIIRLATMVFLRRDGNTTSRPPEILFFRTHLGYYAGCLILSNILISVAGLINFNWAAHSGISSGSLCSTQGALVQIGIWGTSWFTVAHSIHTLCSLGFHVRSPRWRGWAGVICGWTIALAAGLVPLAQKNVYSPTGTSCAVAISYPLEILLLEALPIFLGALTLIVAYFVMFVILRGKLKGVLAQDLSSRHHRGDERSENYSRFICAIVRSLFWFPFVFMLLCLPFCVTHILTFAKVKVPFGVTVFANVCISMLGFINVCLLCNTFRVIAPVYFKRRAAAGTDTVETFGNDASGESPAVSPSGTHWQFVGPQRETNHPAYMQWSSYQSSNSSGSADSTTELVRQEKSSRQSTQTKVAPVVLKNVSPPARLSQRLGGETRMSLKSSPGKDEPLALDGQSAQTKVTHVVLEDVKPPTRHSQRLGGDTRMSMQGSACKGEPSAREDIDSIVIGEDLLAVEPDTPLALDHSNKSSALATRLGIGVAAAGTASQFSRDLSARKLETDQATGCPSPATPNHHQFEDVDIEDSVVVGRPASTASTTTNGSDSDYLWEIMQAQKVRTMSQIHEGYYEDGHGRDMPRVARASMASVWSQESFSLDEGEELQDAYMDLVENSGGHGDHRVGEVVIKPASARFSAAARARRSKAFHHPSKFVSTQLSSILETP